MIKTKHLFDQKGASAIMFALFFIMIITLISLGFATLVRRDQRATLDKTLSSQAQLAAESGINAAKTYIISKGDNLSVANPGENKTNCEQSGTFVYPKLSDGITITCVQWDATPTEVVKSLSPYDGWSFLHTTSTGSDRITWKVESEGLALDAYTGAPGTRTNLSTVQENKLPILKVVTVSKADISNVANPKLEIFYLIPSSKTGGTPTSIALGDGGANTNTNGNAAAFNVACSTDGECSAQVSGYPNPAAGARLYYFQVIGSHSARLTYESLNGLSPKEISNVKTKIDVNAMAQDQSKRLVSYIATSKESFSTWQPFFGAVADNLCKDIKIDGTNNNSVSGRPVCPIP